ncbi:MAG: outer membrane lipoprotein SlyB, partial [Akkermansiaceae bacterium]
TSLRNVAIEGGTSGGAILGGVAGGLLGNEIGHGAGSTAAKIGGALLGTAIGSRVQKSAGAKQGLQIEVRLDSGKALSVVQEDNPREAFNIGDRVRVYSGGGSRTRVSH